MSSTRGQTVTLPIRNRSFSATLPTGTILFKYTSTEYGYMSNFYPSPLLIDGILYHHVEGYFQAQKFIQEDIETAVRIQHMVSPMECKQEGKRRRMTVERKHDWDNGLRLIVMRRAVLCKFLSSTELATKLMSTGDRHIIEDSSWDNYWGSGSNGNGLNMLGKILVDTRNILRDMDET